MFPRIIHGKSPLSARSPSTVLPNPICVFLSSLHSTATVLPTQRRFKSSVAQDEILKFARAAHEWWDPHGQFNMLHRMNPYRVRYIREKVSDIFGTLELHKPLNNLKILDIGCGGGLLSESLARLGAKVTAVDAAEENIKMAVYHQSLDPSFTENAIEYRASTAERLVDEGLQFDIVCALEIIEHVSDREHFVQSISQLTRPGGVIFLSTINRTLLSYLFTILLAENALGLVPKGTHDHAKYVTPEELSKSLQLHDCKIFDKTGLQYYPLENKWDTAWKTPIELDINYMITAVRQSD